jgi:hypothetical protein
MSNSIIEVHYGSCGISMEISISTRVRRWEKHTFN